MEFSKSNFLHKCWKLWKYGHIYTTLSHWITECQFRKSFYQNLFQKSTLFCLKRYSDWILCKLSPCTAALLWCDDPRCGAQQGAGQHGLAQPGGHRPRPLLPLLGRLHGRLGGLLCGRVHRAHRDHQVTRRLWVKCYNVLSGMVNMEARYCFSTIISVIVCFYLHSTISWSVVCITTGRRPASSGAWWAVSRSETNNKWSPPRVSHRPCQDIPAGESLSFLLVHGTSVRRALASWGRVLQLSSGRVKERSRDVVTNYLGWWNDNGAFYYYHTLPNMTYEVTSNV